MSNFPQFTHKLKLSTTPTIGCWTLMYSIPYKRKEASNRRLQWHVRCVCGKEEDVPEYYMMRPHSPRLDCGCKRKTLASENNLEYRCYAMMHVRCYDKKHIAWKHYGGRGIHVCAEWHKDNPDGLGFARFLEYMGKRPSLQYTIDRVDNDGSYYPFQADGVTRQVRWATRIQQRNNQRTPAQMLRDHNLYKLATQTASD